LPDFDEVRYLCCERKTLDRILVDGLHRVEYEEAAKEDHKSENLSIMILILLERPTALSVKQYNVHVSFFNKDRLTPHPYPLCAALSRRTDLELEKKINELKLKLTP
jgi:hypothetical protein